MASSPTRATCAPSSINGMPHAVCGPHSHFISRGQFLAQPPARRTPMNRGTPHCISAKPLHGDSHTPTLATPPHPAGPKAAADHSGGTASRHENNLDLRAAHSTQHVIPPLATELAPTRRADVILSGRATHVFGCTAARTARSTHSMRRESQNAMYLYTGSIDRSHSESYRRSSTSACDSPASMICSRRLRKRTSSRPRRSRPPRAIAIIRAATSPAVPLRNCVLSPSRGTCGHTPGRETAM